MPVTKVDEKGRILLPNELRKRMGITPGEEFMVADIDADVVILKRIDVKKMLEEMIEKVKGVDFDKLEKEIEEEGNRVARKKNTRFLIDTNLFIAAVKNEWAKTTDLILNLLTNPDLEIIANDVSLAEYEKYSKELSAEEFLEFLKVRISVINPLEDDIEKCRAYFPENEVADVVHAATCLKAKAVLITNDRHFEKIKEAGLIEVWSISETMSILL